MWVRVECINGPFNPATTHPRSPLDGQYIVNISTREELAQILKEIYVCQVWKYSTTQSKQLKACVGLHVSFCNFPPKMEDDFNMLWGALGRGIPSNTDTQMAK